jgi:hypothetical protein
MDFRLRFVGVRAFGIMCDYKRNQDSGSSAQFCGSYIDVSVGVSNLQDSGHSRVYEDVYVTLLDWRLFIH